MYSASKVVTHRAFYSTRSLVFIACACSLAETGAFVPSSLLLPKIFIIIYLNTATGYVRIDLAAVLVMLLETITEVFIVEF